MKNHQQWHTDPSIRLFHISTIIAVAASRRNQLIRIAPLPIQLFRPPLRFVRPMTTVDTRTQTRHHVHQVGYRRIQLPLRLICPSTSSAHLASFDIFTPKRVDSSAFPTRPHCAPQTAPEAVPSAGRNKNPIRRNTITEMKMANGPKSQVRQLRRANNCNHLRHSADAILRCISFLPFVVRLFHFPKSFRRTAGAGAEGNGQEEAGAASRSNPARKREILPLGQ